MNIQFKKDQLYTSLREDILSGKYPPGKRLPNEKEFSVQLGVGFLTLRSALKRLEEEQLITRLRSRGTFVNALPMPQAGRAKKILVCSVEMINAQTIEQDPFYRQFAFGAVGQAQMSNLELTFDGQQDISALLPRYRRGEFCGIIWDIPSAECFETIIALREANVPQLVINREFPGISSVSADYPGDIRNAVQALRNFGHRHIALIDVGGQLPVFTNRRQAFLESLGAEVAEPEHYFIGMDEVLWKDWSSHIAGSLARIPRTTAVIVLAQYMMHFSKYLAEFNFAVPTDLSVVQWGERFGFERTSPSPYTILTEPRSEVAKTAIKLLVQQMSGDPNHDRHIHISGELIMRNGCALPHTFHS